MKKKDILTGRAGDSKESQQLPEWMRRNRDAVHVPIRRDPRTQLEAKAEDR
jgi:hypothetical protein